jgi:DNA-binding XRE family transcriptional regulator
VAEVRQLRIDTGGELRAFLHLAQERFQQHLQAPINPPPPPPIQLLSIEPREVISHEPTAILIRGHHLPAEVQVLFGTASPPTAPVCRPVDGEVDVTTPTGLVGDIEVMVQAADNPANKASLSLRFVQREVPRPYCQHIDRHLLKARREQLKLTQKQVADQVGTQQPYLSQLETGKWTKAPDEVYVRLAKVYGTPLSAFLQR